MVDRDAGMPYRGADGLQRKSFKTIEDTVEILSRIFRPLVYKCPPTRLEIPEPLNYILANKKHLLLNAVEDGILHFLRCDVEPREIERYGRIRSSNPQKKN
jgi:hypothetical protein